MFTHSFIETGFSYVFQAGFKLTMWSKLSISASWVLGLQAMPPQLENQFILIAGSMLEFDLD